MAQHNSPTERGGWENVLAPLGLMVVMAAAVAFIVAGVLTSDTFGPLTHSQLARDHGAASAIGSWALPLALAGITTLFSAVAVALARIRTHIRGRRDALVRALPRVLTPTTTR